MTPKEKVESMKRGERVVTSDQELDAVLALGDEAIYEVRTLPNPKRLGVLDQYVGWIEDFKPQEGRP
jgi:hypothetical protein